MPLRLNNQELQNPEPWTQAGIMVPRFDREAMIQATKAAPQWIHFGAGNIFRVFSAALAQSLLEQGLLRTGIVVAEGYDGEIIDTCFSPFDNLTLAVTLRANGIMDKQIIASVASAHRMDREMDMLRAIFANPSLQMASFTITEKGYELTAQAAEDIQTGPQNPKSYLGRIAALCHERYTREAPPLAMVSMDNCSHNGDRLFAAVNAFAKGWAETDHADAGFVDYVQNPGKLSFPWSMIDKITPRPDEGVKNALAAIGMENAEPVVTAKNTWTAPFVNAEETQYLVIEEAFPNGRPPLEKAGVLFTNRETVDKVEKMKVCTCLNPLHTALAVFGCLLGYTRISDEMKNPDLVKLIEGIGYREGLPVVVDPGIINPNEFIDTVIQTRLPNPFMPDTPQRIACDTSQKIPIRFGETIKAYLRDGVTKGDVTGLNVNSLTLIPLVLAAWLRYLLGIDDKGMPFEVSPDPLYPSLKSTLAGINLGDMGGGGFSILRAALEPVLSNSKIFAVNLYEAGLGEKVETYFGELLAGPGAVAATLHKYVNIQS
jgi:fructuronate reductase